MDLLLARDGGPLLPRGQLLGIAAEEQDAGAAEADIGAAVGLHLLPQPQRLAGQRDLGAGAPLLAAPAPVARRLLGADMALLDQGHRMAVAREVPGGADTDDAAADHHDVGALGQAVVAGDAVDGRGHARLLRTKTMRRTAHRLRLWAHGSPCWTARPCPERSEGSRRAHGCRQKEKSAAGAARSGRA